MTPDILEAFEADSVNFTVYAVQIEGKAGQSKVRPRYTCSFMFIHVYSDDDSRIEGKTGSGAKIRVTCLKFTVGILD